MEQALPARTPAHVWIVGGLALLWNAFGAFDYLMTRMRNMDYLGSMGLDPEAILAYIDSYPLHAQIGWGLGVWGGVLGSVLLLMRSRYAFHAFAASLFGVVISLGWAAVMGPPMPEGMDQGANAIMPYVIMSVAVLLLIYASNLRRRGVLR